MNDEFYLITKDIYEKTIEKLSTTVEKLKEKHKGKDKYNYLLDDFMNSIDDSIFLLNKYSFSSSVLLIRESYEILMTYAGIINDTTFLNEYEDVNKKRNICRFTEVACKGDKNKVDYWYRIIYNSLSEFSHPTLSRSLLIASNKNNEDVIFSFKLYYTFITLTIVSYYSFIGEEILNEEDLSFSFLIVMYYGAIIKFLSKNHLSEKLIEEFKPLFTVNNYPNSINNIKALNMEIDIENINIEQIIKEKAYSESNNYADIKKKIIKYYESY